MIKADPECCQSILVVEDNDHSRNAIVDLLENEGYKTEAPLPADKSNA